MASAEYQKGYAAGQRRAAREEKQEARQHALLLARYQLAAAIAPEVIRAPWTRTENGIRKHLNSEAGIADTVTSLVHRIEGRL